jgi:hypothetical protein
MKYYTPRHRRHDRRTARERTRRRECRASPATSGGWREEYRAQRVPLPDGGTTDTPDDLPKFVPEPGARVRDREAAPGEGGLLVLKMLDTRADEHLVERTEQTVAEYNTGYPPESPVVRAVYTDDLDARTGWRSSRSSGGEPTTATSARMIFRVLDWGRSPVAPDVTAPRRASHDGRVRRRAGAAGGRP